MKTEEVNFDGLAGPTHHYAGLSFGNIASLQHAQEISNPQQAALQGLEKMRLLMQLGIPQAVLPPAPRPNLSLLRSLGFTGNPEKILKAAFEEAPFYFMAAYSASSMWVANAATVSPSSDTEDHKVHITPANMVSHLHRMQEAEFNYHLFKKIFQDPNYFKIHPPLPFTSELSDEGAANHNRLCEAYDKVGSHLFVYGKNRHSKFEDLPRHFPARQTQEADQVIARRHGLSFTHTLYAKQSWQAIDQGVFHNDVISVANNNLFFYHQAAFEDTDQLIQHLKEKTDFPLYFLAVQTQELSLKEAVASYIFNSQIVTLPSGTMAIIAPMECQEMPRVKAVLDRLITEDNPLTQIHYVDLRQSMRNGGGPACLRLRVVLNEVERKACHQPVFLNDLLYNQLVTWVKRHYRDRLSVQDLLDPQLITSTEIALEELTQIFDLPQLYSFQR